MVGGERISLSTIDIENAAIALYYEGEKPRLGTVAIAVPFTPEKTPISSVMLGDRNTILCQTLAERVVSLTGKIGMVSLFLKTVSPEEAGRDILEMLEEAFPRASKKV